MADVRYPWLTDSTPTTQTQQYNPPGSNPMPEWQYWQPQEGVTNGGWGYADPGVLPASGQSNAPPGYQNTMDQAAVEQLQQNYVNSQNPAPAPTSTPSAPKPSAPKTTTTSTSTTPTSPYTVNPNVDPFAAMGGGVFINGGWVPKNHPLAQQAAAQNPTTSTGSGTSSASTGGMTPFRDLLLQLANAGGRPNTGALQLRLEGARENLEGARKSQSQALQAQLSELGLLGDGATISGLGGLEENLATQYGQAANQIYADEYGRADNRMMEALALLSGLNTSDLDRDVDWFSARSNDAIGRAQAAASGKSADADWLRANSDKARIALEKRALELQKMGLENNYSLGLGGLQQGNDDIMARVLALLGEGGGEGGYV